MIAALDLVSSRLPIGYVVVRVKPAAPGKHRAGDGPRRGRGQSCRLINDATTTVFSGSGKEGHDICSKVGGERLDRVVIENEASIAYQLLVLRFNFALRVANADN
jgi:hypothetical protein